MLKAGAFIYALFVMFIVSMLTLLFLTLTRLYSNEISGMQMQERLDENALSGIQYALGTASGVWQDAQQLDLFGLGKDLVHIQKKKWGFMDVVTSKASHKNRFSIRSALVGYQVPDSLKIGLYLANNQAALHLSGETRLIGNAYLPQSGVKRAYIAGTSYFGDRLIYGEQFLSEKELPIFFDTLGLSLLANSALKQFDLPKQHQQSFLDSTLLISAANVVHLKDLSLKGNIVIQSDTLVEIYPSALLEDVIVMAPSIKVKTGSRFSAQLLAKDSLIVEENCFLEYPSLLVVNTFNDGFVHIGSKANIYGDVWFKSTKPPGNLKRSVLIEKDAEVVGRLLVDKGNLQLNGSVKGVVYTTDFILKHPVGTYKNHLLAARIDRPSLWPDYLFVAKVVEHDKPNILKWLH